MRGAGWVCQGRRDPLPCSVAGRYCHCQCDGDAIDVCPSPPHTGATAGSLVSKEGAWSRHGCDAMSSTRSACNGGHRHPGAPDKGRASPFLRCVILRVSEFAAHKGGAVEP